VKNNYLPIIVIDCGTGTSTKADILSMCDEILTVSSLYSFH
jgi:hypothetical protein